MNGRPEWRRAALAIMRVAVEDRGPHAVTFFSVEHEPALCRAVRRLVAAGVLAKAPAPKGDLATTPGPAWSGPMRADATEHDEARARGT